MAGFGRCIPNLRDASEANPRIRPGRLLRSATPSSATERDLAHILDGMHLRTIIDLRDETEEALDPGDQQLLTHFHRASKYQIECIMKIEAESADEEFAAMFGAVVEAQQRAADPDRPHTALRRLSIREKRRPVPANSAQAPSYTPAASVPRLKFSIPLAARGAMARGLLEGEKLKVASVFLTKGKEEAKATIMRKMDEMGLLGLNKIILERSAKGLCTVLRIIASSRTQPVLVHCFHGKDRTGLVLALVHRLCGTPLDSIVKDYAESDAHGQSEQGRAHFARHEYLTVDKWCRAPAEVIIGTLEHIDEVYGGIHNYLSNIGFDRRWQDKLINSLTITHSELTSVQGTSAATDCSDIPHTPPQSPT
eukprot:m.6527 g.6527  ORF g.6527 m.6527 type:complete len:366 (+) comp5169_c0_seq2:84-1181(+)